ncbi:MAG TPA: C39 family peptidase [Armatimonadota bacterium]|jgi:hypothetical protein
MPINIRAMAALAILAVTTMTANATSYFGKTDVFATAAQFAHIQDSGARYDERAGGFRLLDDPAGGYVKDGSVISEGLHYGFGFNTAVASWNADCPAGTWVKVELQTSTDNGADWSPWFEMAMWGDPVFVDKDLPSGKVKAGKEGKVNEDTLELAAKATRLRYRVRLHTEYPAVTPVVSLIAVTVVDKTHEVTPDDGPGPAWGKEVAADFRSQLWEAGDISWRICGPTSMGMALTSHGVKLPTAEVARAAWDNVNRIYGNWPFLTAAGSDLMRRNLDSIPSLPGKRKVCHAYVSWLPGWKPVEDEILKGNPVVISLAFAKGVLRGGPLDETDGHLILVRGFTKDGDVICNDPASRTEKGGRVIYDRKELLEARKGGPIMVFHPYD